MSKVLRHLARIASALWIPCLFAGPPAPASAADIPVIAAASDLQFALTEIATAFTQATGSQVRLSFGSSGNIARQIEQGAPFELFLAADEELLDDLAAKKMTLDAGVLYALGRIVLMVPMSSPLKPDGKLEDLAAALKDGRIKRFVIANPDHAPYGKRAQEALQHAGLWQAMQDRLVLGENVSQAAQFTLSGSAQGGILAYSLALEPSLARLGSFALIPEDWHSPLRQRMALIRGAGPTAKAFYAFLQSPSARAIMRRFGFLLPGESG